MVQMSRKLTIFEGPDGGGKSTAAKAFADLTGAVYVHFPALLRVGRGLPRMYVEAMLPALLGYQDVVFDRCWLSEVPYGEVHREGWDRIGDSSRRMLERLAMRCGAVVVKCLPAWETVRDNYTSRKAIELLDSTSQLRSVYDIYRNQSTDLPEVRYDYTTGLGVEALWDEIEPLRFDRHPVDLKSAGNLNARVVLVGEAFGERKSVDPFYQWPFASFSGEGCSQWLTDQLRTFGPGEDELFWINADQDLSLLRGFTGGLIVALGDIADGVLSDVGVNHVKVPHPQRWKRFNHGRRYSLIDALIEFYNGSRQ